MCQHSWPLPLGDIGCRADVRGSASVAIAAGRAEPAGDTHRTEVLILGTAGGPPLRPWSDWRGGADLLLAQANTRDPQDAGRPAAALATRNHGSSRRTQAFRQHFRVEHLNACEIGDLAAQAQAVLLSTTFRRMRATRRPA